MKLTTALCPHLARAASLFILTGLSAALAGCGAEDSLLSQTPPPAGQAAAAGFGQHFPSLSPQDVELFLAGRDDFLEVEEAEED
jgi:hypothetical protein